MLVNKTLLMGRKKKDQFSENQTSLILRFLFLQIKINGLNNAKLP